MTALRVLIVGGNGIISSSVSRLAVERGMDVTLLNRGQSTTRPAIEGAGTLVGDAEDPESMRAAVGTRTFDVVVNFLSFLPQQAAADVELWAGRTGQYVYISSASAYQKPVAHLPIVESTPLANPFWQYSRDKAESERVLMSAYRDQGFPVTVVRPSHTYDPSLVPLDGGWGTLARIRDGRPIVVHGDGTSLWTLTHARDFAAAFVGLLGNPHALGGTVHITSDEWLSWNAIAGQLGSALGVEPQIVHVPSDAIARVLPEIGDGLLGDKAHSVIFDNSRIRSLVLGWVATTPFASGAREIVEWHLASPERRIVDPAYEAAIDGLIATHG